MTHDEFNEWVRYLKLKLPGIAAWIGKKPEKSSNLEVSRAELLNDWRDQLSHISLIDAKAGIDALYEGKVETPREFNRIPVKVRQYAYSIATPGVRSEPYWNGKDWEYQCEQCHHTGMVSVAHPKAMRLMFQKREEFETRDFSDMAVACTCSFGDKLANGKRKPMIRYRRDKMCILGHELLNKQEKIEELREWVEMKCSGELVKHAPNHTPEFDAFNEGQF